MGNKILTIAICAYNMENYICECLDSCLIDGLDDLEILVMNDGSTDRTAKLVSVYCNRYPGSIYLINKPNGGWGSNLNRAVEIATGKYLKILDADDWFERENLQILVNFMKTTDVDLIATKHRNCYVQKKEVDIPVPEWQKYCGEERILENINEGLLFSIWDVSYKTQMVQRNYLALPDNYLYTDVLYIYRQTPHVKTIFFMDLEVYNYRLGRDGQSVSRESVHKHYREMLSVLDIMLDAYKKGLPGRNYQHMLRRLIGTYNIFVRHILCLEGYEDVKGAEVVKQYEKALKENYREIYEKTNESKFFKAIRLTHYKFIKILLYLGRCR